MTLYSEGSGADTTILTGGDSGIVLTIAGGQSNATIIFRFNQSKTAAEQMAAGC